MQTTTKPTYTKTFHLEPKKDYRYVKFTDSAGELHEGVVETLESMRRRVAWSKTAGPDEFRSLDLWLLEQGVK